MDEWKPPLLKSLEGGLDEVLELPDISSGCLPTQVNRTAATLESGTETLACASMCRAPPSAASARYSGEYRGQDMTCTASRAMSSHLFSTASMRPVDGLSAAAS
jgi:hypothetical protein